VILSESHVYLKKNFSSTICRKRPL